MRRHRQRLRRRRSTSTPSSATGLPRPAGLGECKRTGVFALRRPTRRRPRVCDVTRRAPRTPPPTRSATARTTTATASSTRAGTDPGAALQRRAAPVPGAARASDDGVTLPGGPVYVYQLRGRPRPTPPRRPGGAARAPCSQPAGVLPWSLGDLGGGRHRVRGRARLTGAPMRLCTARRAGRRPATSARVAPERCGRTSLARPRPQRHMQRRRRRRAMSGPRRGAPALRDQRRRPRSSTT